MKVIDKGLHPRNVHNASYDFEKLIETFPSLALHVKKNRYDNFSIDFASSSAVLALNQALLAHFYDIKEYNLPKNSLIAPIPGRADYLHYIADIVLTCKDSNKDKKIRGLDIGIGANCIYPLLGARIYDWNFVGSDINPNSIKSAQKIIQLNSNIEDKIVCKQQENSNHIFIGIIGKNDRFDFTMCNPPFHASEYEATQGSMRKIKNLSKGKKSIPSLNFKGDANELWCEGGEVAFIRKMIQESKIHAKKVKYFTTLVSKKESLTAIYKAISKANVMDSKTIEMKQGQKITRIVAWSFTHKF